eukprot:m51a1_g11784 putative methionine aminopeptidase (400) ;mRNA; f:295926-297299
MKCEKCGKTATFRCPKCAELGLPDSNWCSQDCYKAGWKAHKPKHAAKEALIAAASSLIASVSHAPAPRTGPVSELFAGYSFTGSLRPAEVTERRTVPSTILFPDYATTGIPVSEEAARGAAIEVKNAEQILGMREAGRVAREVIDIAGRAVKPGVTTDEIDRIVHEATVERGAYPSPLNYRGFPKSVCTSVNEVICHGIPDKRELQEGDIVNVDVTCFYKGYHGDVNETYPVGEIDNAAKRLIQTTYECLEQAIRGVSPGAHYRDIGEVISKHAHRQGFSVVRSYTGHGIGNLFHTAPNVPHYSGNKALGIMHPGHTFTIEPMINEGVFASDVWPDDWTVVTKDGKRSAQFEQTMLVTDKGVDVLTKRTKDSYPYWFLDKPQSPELRTEAADHRQRRHK